MYPHEKPLNVLLGAGFAVAFIGTELLLLTARFEGDPTTL